MRRFLFASLGSILGVLALVLTFVAVLLGTESGFNWALEQAQRARPGLFSVESAEGHLLGRLHLRNVRLDLPTAAIAIGDLVLDWRPTRLLRREFDLTRLGIDRVSVDTVGRVPEEPEPAPEPAYPVTLPDLRLPIAINVEWVEVNRIEIRSAADADPLRVDHVSLRTRWDEAGLRIQRLAVAMPGLEVEVDGTLDPVGDYPVDLNTLATLALEGIPHGVLRGTIAGDAGELDIAQRFSGDAEVALTATLLKPLKALSWDGGIQIVTLPGTIITPDLPVDINGTIASIGDLRSASVEAKLRSDSQSAPQYELKSALSASMDFETRSVRVDHFEAEHQALPMRAVLAGSASVDERRVDLEGSWHELRWPLAGEPIAGSGEGLFRLRGTLDDYVLALESDVYGKDIPGGTWKFDAEGSGTQLGRLKLVGETLDGTLTTTGTVAWKPAVHFDIEAKAEHINPGVQFADWNGSIDLDSVIRGEIGDAGPVVNVVLKTLQGELRGLPLHGKGEVNVSPEAIDVAHLNLGSGRAYVRANGRLASDSDLKWEINVPHAGDLLPAAAGSVVGHGGLSGPKMQPFVRVNLDASTLSTGQFSVEALSVSGNVDLSDRERSNVRLSGRRIVAEGQTIESLTLTGDGRLEQHDLAAELVHGMGRLDLALQGGVQEMRWSGVLGRLALENTDIGPWILERAVKLAAGATEAKADSLCLRRERARVCAQGEWRKFDAKRQETAGEFSVSGFPLAWLKPWLPEDIKDIEGDLSAEGSAEIAQQISGRLNTSVTPGKIIYLHHGTGEVSLPHEGLKLVAKAGEDAITADLRLSVADSRLSAGFRSPDILSAGDPMQARIDARIELNGPDLDYVSALVPAASEVRGGIVADLDVKGTLGDPMLDGKGTIRVEKLTVPEFGIALNDSFVDLVGRGRSYEIDGKLASADGKLDLKGRGELDADAGWPAKVTISGENFRAVSLPEADVYVSPDLYMEKTPELLQLAGEVAVPKADIFLRSLPSSARTAHDDVVVIQEEIEAVEEATHTPIKVDVSLTLGREIHFVGFGLDAFFDGGLRVRADSGEALSVAGDVRIDQGTFRAYGQDLTIEQGIISFAGGPPTNPGINLRATRQIDEVLAGINAIGPIRRPRITTFSTPAMAERDVISYLLTGKPASALGGGGGGTLSVGRQINSKLSASVGTNLETGEAEFSTRYRLNRKLHVQGSTTSRSSAADIFFTHELE